MGGLVAVGTTPVAAAWGLELGRFVGAEGCTSSARS